MKGAAKKRKRKTRSRQRRSTVIAIDGPAGSGKSTVSKRVAEKLRFLYIDTGAMYRALTLKALRQGADLQDEEALTGLAGKTRIVLNTRSPKGATKVFLDGEDVTRKIRTPKITNKVFYVAKVKGVREHMASQQRKMGKAGSCVMEGRDIGTVVFPDADKKFYIDAKFEERVRRRFKDLKLAGGRPVIDEVRKDLRARDRKDKGRKIAPLAKAKNAIYIDTTKMSIKEVVEEILTIILGQT